MTKAEKRLRYAMRNLNRAFAELHKEKGIPYNGYFSACRMDIPSEKTIYYEVLNSSTEGCIRYTWKQESRSEEFLNEVENKN